MSKLIVLMHSRHTGPELTSMSLALKRKNRRCRAGCASSTREKEMMEMERVGSLRLPQSSLLERLGSNVST